MYQDENQYYQFIKDNLISHKISEVFYEELNSFDNDGQWDLSDGIHSVSMNVVLVLQNGKIVRIKWDSTFYSFGVETDLLQKIENNENYRTINVTQHFNWENYLGKTIKSVEVLWYNQVPQTWKIEFEDNMTIWISTLEIELYTKEHRYMADHLTVFFNGLNVKEYFVDKFEKRKVLD
ncbi:hypothetical protein [Flavobacterium sp.]|uniref:hypothetical protein n=1 Tax=Flavobacterium sp. TaxID=239 RepID=UPI003A9158F3